MKILFIYYLKEYPPFDEKTQMDIKVMTNVDLVAQMQACNQINGIQYPYFVIENFE